jgi:hypothetical protein
LKDKLPPGSKSIAFTCSTINRVASFYDQDFNVAWNLESGAFRAHFPSTPLFGFLAENEFGSDAFPRDHQAGENLYRASNEIQHDLGDRCSFFMIIAVGPHRSN